MKDVKNPVQLLDYRSIERLLKRLLDGYNHEAETSYIGLTLLPDDKVEEEYYFNVR
jgi:hypothetical protein